MTCRALLASLIHHRPALACGFMVFMVSSRSDGVHSSESEAKLFGRIMLGSHFDALEVPPSFIHSGQPRL